jgi:hypothetical protein
MRLYNNFIGINIGKFTFVVALHGEKTTQEYANTLEGIQTRLKLPGLPRFARNDGSKRQFLPPAGL